MILIFLTGGFYFLNRHFKRIETQDERAYELSIGEQKRATQNDSLAQINKTLANEVDRLNKDIADIKNQKQILYINNVNKSKSDVSKLAPEQNKILIGLIEE